MQRLTGAFFFRLCRKNKVEGFYLQAPVHITEETETELFERGAFADGLRGSADVD